jgi:hypothetical protein
MIMRKHIIFKLNFRFKELHFIFGAQKWNFFTVISRKFKLSHKGSTNIEMLKTTVLES